MTARRRSCVLLADAARARLFLYRPAGGQENEPSNLLEIYDLVNPWSRHRDSEMFTDSRPGLRQARPGGPRHGVDDRRDGHRDEDRRRFAEEIVGHATAICERSGRCPLVIVSGPAMLGLIRDALEAAPAWMREGAGTQFDRDLTDLETPRVHDWLAARDVLPPRPRLGLGA